VTFSGATTADLLGRSASGQPAQVDAVSAGTRLVTVTVGGNDIGYIGTLTLSSLPWPLRAMPSARRAIADAADPATIDARFAALHASLTRLVAEIRARAPETMIVFVDYLTILPPDDAGFTVRPRGGAPYHPNAAGMRAVAALLEELLGIPVA
jgi:lysophospholipase L1-like esterase